MTQWYLSVDGNQIGPMDNSQAISKARQNPEGFAWRDGYADWQPIASIAELNPSPGVPVPGPPPVVAARSGADEIDFKIFVDPDLPLPSSVFSRENERAAGRTVRALRTRVFEVPQGSG